MNQFRIPSYFDTFNKYKKVPENQAEYKLQIQDLRGVEYLVKNVLPRCIDFYNMNPQ